jgi:hypothetical protein
MTRSCMTAERSIALESLEHNAAANDAAVQALNENAGLGLETDSAFASKSGGNAADNDVEVEDGLGLETDTAFAGHSGGNAAANDAEVDGTVGEVRLNGFRPCYRPRAR